jgi:hypothetical protein
MTRPSNHEVPRGIHRHLGKNLALGRVAVDTELAALGYSGCIESLSVDSIAGTVLAVPTGNHVAPRHDEVAVGVHRHGRVELSTERIRVDAELGT